MEKKMRKIVYTLAVLACVAAPAATQEKEFVLDRTTGAVTAKDVEQDKEIAALKKEVAYLKAQLAVPTPPVRTATASGVAVSPFDPSCPLLAVTPAPAAVTPPTALTYSSAPARYEGLTYTAVPYAGSGGTTSGCAGGSCAAPARGVLFRRFR